MTQRYEKIGRVSTASVKKGTGKDWVEWLSLLNTVHAQTWSHREIVLYLRKKYKLSLWWEQGVTLGYEIAIGRRVEGQDSKGLYSVSCTKTLSIEASRLWRFLVGTKGVSIWMKPLFPVKIKIASHFETEDGFFGEIRTIKVGRRLRMSWKDENETRTTYVELIIVPLAAKKTILVVQHMQLKNLKIQSAMRKRWKEILVGIQGQIKS